MKIISHRGNIKGKVESKENRPSYIDCAIQLGYEVEVDVRYNDNQFWIGHDEPQYKVGFEWIMKRLDNIWYHCKDLDSASQFSKLNSDIKYFCHSQDPYVLTSTGHLWVHDLSMNLDQNCIIPLISEKDIEDYDGILPYAICTDYVKRIV